MNNIPSSSAQPEPSQNRILWRQVWGLAVMLAAILISFKAYELYQPSILRDLGFTGLVSILGIIQGLLGMVVEPLVGGLSDRILCRFGSRLPQITLGVTLAGLIFVTVALIPQDGLLAGIRGLIPGLMIIWLMAMIAVRGPIVAMLRQFAPVDELAHANALIILVLGLVGTIAPLLDLFLKQIGPSPTFIVGAIALLIGAGCLFTSNPRHTLAPFIPGEGQPVSRQRLGLIFLVGVGASLEMGLVMAVYPKALQTQLPSLRLEWITAAILLVSALSANPWERLTSRLGAARAMQIGLAGILVFMLLTLFTASFLGAILGGFLTSILGIIALLGFGLAMGLLFISIIPFALSGIPLSQAGLSTGLYFGGSGLAGAIASRLLQPNHPLTPWNAFGWAIACFFLTYGWLNMTRKWGIGSGK